MRNLEVVKFRGGGKLIILKKKKKIRIIIEKIKIKCYYI